MEENYKRKIKKLLALATSSNPHEAETAKRQAAALMAKHGIAEGELEIVDLESIKLPYRSLRKSDSFLLAAVLDISGSHSYFSLRHVNGRYRGMIRFIGNKVDAELAKYAFEVLYRQMTQAISILRCDRKRLTFEQLEAARVGWIKGACTKLKCVFPSRSVPDSVLKVVNSRFGNNEFTEVRKLDVPRKSVGLMARGYEEGLKAQLHAAANHESVPMLSQKAKR